MAGHGVNDAAALAAIPLAALGCLVAG